MIGDLSVTITGLEQAEATFSDAHFTHGLAAGMEQAGQAAAEQAKLLIAPHRYTGRYADEIRVSVSGAADSPRIEVGARVPEAGPLSFGWHGHGQQPPTEAIAAWLDAGRGPRTGGMAGAGLAFVIARAIGRRGFNPATTPALHVWTRAYEAVRGRLAEFVAASLRTGGA